MGKQQSKSSRKDDPAPTTVEHQKIYKPHNYYVPLPSPNPKVFQYKGNRKHANISNVNYLYPIDDNESDRIQDHHYIYRYVWDNNFSAPINELLNSHGSTILG